MAVESIAKTPVEQQLLEICDRVLPPQGFRAVEVDCRVGPRSLVRIFVEKASGEAHGQGVTLDECADVSRTIGELFDQESPIPGAFDLEISSPGIDRRLRLMADFETRVGEEVKLQLLEKLEGFGANLTGTLVGVEPGLVVVKVGKADARVPLAKIKRANVVWKSK